MRIILGQVGERAFVYSSEIAMPCLIWGVSVEISESVVKRERCDFITRRARQI